MDDALFLKTARAQIEASQRLDLPASFTPDHALRLLEMAERWQAHEELCRTAADPPNPPPSAPSDAMR